MPFYMEGWEDNDNKGLNGEGYTYGVDRTAEMFQDFVKAAAGRNWPRRGQVVGQGRPPMPLPQDARQ